MTQELTRKRAIFREEARTLAARPSWQRLALAAILILSTFFYLFRITQEGWGNPYYAAGVKSMLTSWSNFFFVSFDAGFVSVDKPPLGLWIQAASAWLLGFHGWALLLPQALAGLLSVALLYHLVHRAFGPVAGLLAALALALTPTIVATSRNNTSDMLVVLAVLVAAWAVVRAAEAGNLRWLLLCAVVVGLGFNVKMLQAFLVLPAFYLLYLVAAPVNRLRRFVHLGVATVVLVVVSLSWAVAVDLTLEDQRLYVGSSDNNSALELAVGYNGLERVLGREGMPGGGPPPGGGKEEPQQVGFIKGAGPGGFGENGEPGFLRLLNQQLAGQVGWLLPLAVAGLLVAGWRGWQRGRPRLPLDVGQQALVLWGTWFFTAAAYFSIAGRWHRYYLVMLAPAIAALVGIGVVALWKDYRNSGNRRGWLLPLVLVGMAAVQVYILRDYEGWPLWLGPPISGLCVVAAAILVFARIKRSRPETRITSSNLQAGAAAAGVLALLVAPTAWASYTMFEGVGGLPAAGPRPVQTDGGPGGPGGPPRGGPGGPGSAADPALVEYLQANKGATYLVAVDRAMGASPIILNTDERVITLTGFEGHDPVFTTDEISDLVNESAVRFFMVPDKERMEQMRAGREASGGGGPPGPPPGPDSEVVTWVQDSCEKVPQEEWQSPETEGQGGGSPGGPGRAQGLYDCGSQEGNN